VSYVPLGKLVDIKGGGTPSRENPRYWGGSIPWATVKDFKSTTLDCTEESITLDGVQESATNVIRAGAVIIPTRMAVGKAAINTIDLAINQDLKALLPSKKVDTNFLLHFLLSKSEELGSRAQGATVKGIKLDLLRELPFPNLAIAQQRRIAAILDKADDVRRKRAQTTALADQLLKSTFREMFEGQSWRVKTLADVVTPGTIVTYGIVQAGPEHPTGVPYIRTGDIKDGEIVQTDLRHTSPEIASRFGRSRVRAGEIVMSIRATVGTTAFVPPELDGANLTQGTARISPGPKVTPEYLLAFLRSQRCQCWIQEQVKGATFREITLARLRQLEVPLPPKHLQDRFSKFAVALRATRDRAVLDESVARTLFASLSQRAFCGEI
jgi:type I restriction enzyme S subunit